MASFFLEKPEFREYNQTLITNILSSPEHTGLVIFAECDQDWEILFGIMQQGWHEGYNNERYRPARFQDSWGTIENHAINVEWDGYDKNLVFGWCSTSWYRNERRFKNYRFRAFSEVFHRVDADAPDFETMFSWEEDAT